MTKMNVSRRQFLSTMGLAAGAAAFPTIVPDTALGRGGIPAPSDRITMGFIGLGSMGMGNLVNFMEKDDVQVVAVCDVNKAGEHYAGDGQKGRDPALLAVYEYYSARSGSAFKGCDGYEFFWQVLERDDIDAVCLALPDHWHAYMAVAAAKAGKDMYSEKPLSRTIYEGRQMVKAVRKYDRVFQTGSQQRSDQRFRHACELVRNGYIGEVQKVFAAVGGVSQPCTLDEEPIPEGFLYEMWLGNAPSAPYNPLRTSGSYSTTGGSWRSYRPYSAGHVSDWGAHNYDISLWGLGLDRQGPVKIQSAADSEDDEMTLFYKNGIPIVKKEGPEQGMIQFFGSEGWVGVSRGDIWASDEKLLRQEMTDGDVHLYKSDNHRRNFLNCVKTRQLPICDVEIGHSSVTACLTSEIGMRLGRTLEWDEKKEDFVNDAEASALVTREMRGPWKV